jgi:hypothetical protein
MIGWNSFKYFLCNISFNFEKEIMKDVGISLQIFDLKP